MEQELYVDFPKLVYREHILWNEGRSRTFYEFSPGAGMVNPRDLHPGDLLVIPALV